MQRGRLRLPGDCRIGKVAGSRLRFCNSRGRLRPAPGQSAEPHQVGPASWPAADSPGGLSYLLRGYLQYEVRDLFPWVHKKLVRDSSGNVDDVTGRYFLRDAAFDRIALNLAGACRDS